MTFRMPTKLGKTVSNDIENALEISYPRTCDLLFSSPCVPLILRVRERVDGTAALVPDYAQMRAHIVTVINNRTRGLAPMMMGNLNDEASSRDAGSDEFVESKDGELYRLEIRSGKKVFTKPRHDSSKGNTKGGGKGRTDSECFRCGRIGHIRADCRAKTHINESAPKGKAVGSCEEEDPESSQNVPLRPSILRCCQTTVTPKKMMAMLMNS